MTHSHLTQLIRVYVIVRMRSCGLTYSTCSAAVDLCLRTYRLQVTVFALPPLGNFYRFTALS